jgi:iron complex outermembrane receptor protein
MFNEHRIAKAVRIALAAAAMPAMYGACGVAVAQSAAQLEDITVTAQRREERLGDVPIAASAISAESALSRGINDTTALEMAVPGLVINHTANEGNIFIRGVGTNLFGPASEQTVALYIDGVYMPSPEANLFSFNNIERIEVLKGPQGTLFGRNTTGGVVQIITREPSPTLTGDFSISYGNFQTLAAQGYLAGGLSDNVSADIAVMFEDQGEGWGKNFTTGKDNGIMADDNYSVRSKLRAALGERTTVDFAVDYTRQRVKYDYQLRPGIISPIDGVSTYPGDYDAVGGLDDYELLKGKGASINFQHDADAFRLVNILAYRNTDVEYVLDQDDTPAVAADLSLPSYSKGWSEELQIHSPESSKIKWMVGAFYFQTKAGYDPVDINNGVVVIDDYQKTRSIAGFTQLTFPLSVATNLTVGGRYTSEKQDFLGTTFLLGTNLGTFSDSQKFSEVTWRVSLDHHFTDDVMAYVSANRGFKSGGFNLITVAGVNSFLPEELDAYELGIKSDWLNRTLRVNAAAFWYTYKDIQIQVPVQGGTSTTNGPRARIKGLEAEVQARPIEWLTLSAGATYLDAEYTEYPVALAIGPLGEAGTVDATGNRTIGAPELTANASATVAIPLSTGRIETNLSASYNDGFFFYADNRLKQPPYSLVNASVTWLSDNDRWSVSAWGKNLGDEEYFAGLSAQGGLGDAQRRAAPRTYGVSARVRF